MTSASTRLAQLEPTYPGSHAQASRVRNPSCGRLSAISQQKLCDRTANGISLRAVAVAYSTGHSLTHPVARNDLLWLSDSSRLVRRLGKFGNRVTVGLLTKPLLFRILVLIRTTRPSLSTLCATHNVANVVSLRHDSIPRVQIELKYVQDPDIVSTIS